MAVYYLDPENGNNANAGTSFALRKRTPASFGTTPGPGDEIRIIASPDPQNFGTCTWQPVGDADAAKQNNYTIKFPAQKVQLVHGCNSGWVASANVTGSNPTTLHRSGTACTSLSISTTFTTGKAAYVALGATLDLSGYEGISMSFGRTSGAASNLAAGQMELWLCSDAVGDVPLLQIPIPAQPQGGSIGYMKYVYWENGSTPLPSGINSISLRVITDVGTTVVYTIDNIVATKHTGHADHVSHGCFIAHEDVVNNTNASGFAMNWLPISAFTEDGQAAYVRPFMFANLSASTSTFKTYRCANDGAYTTYVRQPLRCADFTESQWWFDFANGTIGNPVRITGGWNRTDMSTQTGESFFSGMGQTRWWGYCQKTNFWFGPKISVGTYPSSISSGAVLSGSNLTGKVRIEFEHVMDNSGFLTSYMGLHGVTMRVNRLSQHNSHLFPDTFYYQVGNVNVRINYMTNNTARLKTFYRLEEPPYLSKFSIGWLSDNVGTLIDTWSYGTKFTFDFTNTPLSMGDGTNSSFDLCGYPTFNGELTFDGVPKTYSISFNTANAMTGTVRFRNGGGDQSYYGGFAAGVNWARVVPTTPGATWENISIHGQNFTYETAADALDVPVISLVSYDSYGRWNDIENLFKIPIGRYALQAGEPATISCRTGRYYGGINIGFMIEAVTGAGVAETTVWMTDHADGLSPTEAVWEDLSTVITPSADCMITVHAVHWRDPNYAYYSEKGYWQNLTVTQ